MLVCVTQVLSEAKTKLYTQLSTILVFHRIDDRWRGKFIIYFWTFSFSLLPRAHQFNHLHE